MKKELLITSFVLLIFLLSYNSIYGSSLSTNEKGFILSAPIMDPISMAEAKRSDKVKVQKAQWVSKKRKERFLIVHAISDAPHGSVTLIAELIAEDKTIQKEEMRYEPDKGYYFVLFPNVWSKPDKVKVTSSGGGSETVSVNFP